MIGLFGGTFDPIHNGHLNLAIELMQIGSLDEIWFVPARCSPFLKNASPIDSHHRLKMVRLAIEGIERFFCSSIEMERDGPSYTIDTLEAIQKSYPQKQFTLLMGEDVALDFHRWKKADQIIKKFPVLIGYRRGAKLLKKIDDTEMNPEMKERLKASLRESRYVDIDATELRCRLKKGLYCGHLIPSKVLDYIYVNKLYSTI